MEQPQSGKPRLPELGKPGCWRPPRSSVSPHLLDSGQMPLTRSTHSTRISFPPTNHLAWFWQPGFFQPWLQQVDLEILQNHLDLDPPRAARAYAYETIAQHDATLAVGTPNTPTWSCGLLRRIPPFSRSSLFRNIPGSVWTCLRVGRLYDCDDLLIPVRPASFRRYG